MAVQKSKRSLSKNRVRRSTKKCLKINNIIKRDSRRAFSFYNDYFDGNTFLQNFDKYSFQKNNYGTDYPKNFKKILKSSLAFLTENEFESFDVKKRKHIHETLLKNWCLTNLKKN